MSQNRISCWQLKTKHCCCLKIQYGSFSISCFFRSVQLLVAFCELIRVFSHLRLTNQAAVDGLWESLQFCTSRASFWWKYTKLQHLSTSLVSLAIFDYTIRWFPLMLLSDCLTQNYTQIEAKKRKESGQKEKLERAKQKTNTVWLMTKVQ